MTANLTVPATGTPEENRDTRLSAALEAINSGRFDLISFDCFDTLLYRKVPKPTDLFEILGQRLLDKGMMTPQATPKALCTQRIFAEETARRDQFRKINSGEILLRHIWQNMPGGMFPGVETSRLIQAELDCENDLLRYDPNMLNLALCAQQKGLSTAIVSDTYFDIADMHRFLDRKSGSFTPDHLLLSSDYGTSKAAGLLAMLPRLANTPAGRILHIGDAPHADVEPAQALGITSCFFPKETQYSKECLFREREYGDWTRPETMYDPLHGDFGLTSLRVKTAFDIQSERFIEGKQPAADLASNVLAPLFSWFAIWVKERAAALGATQLHCLMREGQYLSELIDNDATLPSIKTSTLWASRYALTRAGIYEGTVDETKGFLDRPILMTVQEMAVELGLDSDDVSFHSKQYGDYFNNQDEAWRFLTALYENDHTRKRIVETSTRWRTNYLEYLKSTIDLSGNVPLTLVDLGYSGTIQRSLNNVLAGGGFDHVKTAGLYLLTSHRAAEVLGQGHHIEGYLANMGEPQRMLKSVYRSPEILEQICMPDIGSLLSMNDDGTPILDEFRIQDTQYEQVCFMRQSIAAFQHKLAQQKLADDIEGLPAISASNPALIQQLSRIAEEMILFPVPTELDVIGKWDHDENYASERTRKLIDIDAFDGRLDHVTVQDMAETASHKCFWPIGVAASQDTRLGEAVRRVSMRESTSSSADGLISEGKARIHFDTGEGYGSCPSLDMEYKSNPFGRAWFRGSITVDGVVPVSLGIQFGRQGEVIRIDHLSLSGDRLNGEVFDFDMLQEPGDKLPWLNANTLSKNVVDIEAEPALISLTDLTGKLYGLHQLHVEVRFTAMKPLPEAHMT